MTPITKTTDDVFQALGFSAEVAEDLRLRSELLIKLQERIRELNVAQAKVAKLLEISQPRVSDLLRGKIDKFSVESVAGMLRKLGSHVEVVVKRDDDVFADLFCALRTAAVERTDQPNWAEPPRMQSIVVGSDVDGVATPSTGLPIAA
jgi:predicted XRE-type DNA-binding protein